MSSDAARARLAIRGYTHGSDLSSRELDVLTILADGFTDPEIARHYWIARSTVKSHVRHILARLGARNRTHAVALAIRQGLIP